MTTSNKKINNKNSNSPVVKEGELVDNNVLINTEEQTMNIENLEENNLDINEDSLDKTNEENIEENIEEPVDFEAEVKKLIEEMGYEQIFAKLTTVQNIAKSGSKMEKCVDIYKEMIVDEKNRRIDIINAFVSQQGISKEHASTYFQTIRTRLKKATGQ